MRAAELGTALLQLARGAIAARLGVDAPQPSSHKSLETHAATFVTLTRQGQLRGCIGSLEARRPLHLDVRENALAAAFGDPRFSPLRLEEYAGISVEVSLLTPPVAMRFADEEDLLAQLRPGVDGVIFRCGRHRSTFLPQVWESLPDPRAFMSHLKRKGGLPADFWAEDVSVFRYEVSKWKEEDEDADLRG